MSLGLPAKQWTNPAKSGWAEVGPKKSSASLCWCIVDSLFLFVYDSDESLGPNASHTLIKCTCRVAKSSEVASGKRGIIVSIGKENILLQVETDEEVAEWISAIELQQRTAKPPSPKMPEKASKPAKTARPKPTSSKDTAVGKQDKKTFDEVATDGASQSEYIQTVIKGRPKPPGKRAPPSRQLRQQQANESQHGVNFSTNSDEVDAIRAEIARGGAASAASSSSQPAPSKAVKPAPRATPRQGSAQQLPVGAKPQPPVAAKRRTSAPSTTVNAISPAGGEESASASRVTSADDLAEDLGFEMIDDDEDLLAAPGESTAAAKPAAAAAPASKPREATPRKPAPKKPVASKSPAAKVEEVSQSTTTAPVPASEEITSASKDSSSGSRPSSVASSESPITAASPTPDSSTSASSSQDSQPSAPSPAAAMSPNSGASTLELPQEQQQAKSTDDAVSVTSSGSEMEMATVAMSTPAATVTQASSSTVVTNKPLTTKDFSQRSDSSESMSSEEKHQNTMATIKERQEVAMALSQAIEVLRVAKQARDQAHKELAEAERKKHEAEATKRQALEILRMAREAVKQLK